MPNTSIPDREALRISLSPTLQVHWPGGLEGAPVEVLAHPRGASRRAPVQPVELVSPWYQTSEPA